MSPVRLFQDDSTGDRFLIYATERGVKVELRYQDDTLWLSQAQIAELFAVDRSSVTKHLGNIFSEGELERDRVCAKNSHTATDGKTYEVQYYNLDAIISVGYRVNSRQGTLFRRWATDTLVQFATKGFVVDVARMKSPEARDRIAELRDIIRDIRSDEANVYRELRRICSMCSDYDPKADASHAFFMNMQAKIMYAVTSNTPSEIIMGRANASHPDMGLRVWAGDDIQKRDSEISKNYLAPHEIRELNRVTTILLDVFEDQLDIGKLTTMTQAEDLLNAQLSNLGRAVLSSGGSVSRAQAIGRAHEQYKLFDDQRRRVRHEQADKNLQELKATGETLAKPRRKK